MNTPIYDYLREYAAKNPVRFHMPGHKGRLGAPPLHDALPLDLTEIPGADSLYAANGIIARSEANAAHLFGAGNTFYSCGGATLCIQTMMLLMKQENRTIVAARGVHRSFLNACVLLDLPVEWVYPREGGVLSGRYHPDDFAQVLQNLQRPACVYVTSPDYLGNMADVAAISKVCRQYSAKLLVDNAHGAHLAFLPHRLHPIQLGADYSCDSAHKMLSGLTGTAYLHLSYRTDTPAARVRDAMSIFASTSPSYLMLASLDWCNRELATPLFRKQLSEITVKAMELRRVLSRKYTFVEGEPLHLTVDCMASGVDGEELRTALMARGIVPEYADSFYVVFLLSAATRDEELMRLRDALEGFVPHVPAKESRPVLPRPQVVCGVREAALAPQELIPVETSRGRICGQTTVPCPPAVPIVLSGERMDEEAIETCLAYGVERISVVK